jgi:hypothetical protein
VSLVQPTEFAEKESHGVHPATESNVVDCRLDRTRTNGSTATLEERYVVFDTRQDILKQPRANLVLDENVESVVTDGGFNLLPDLPQVGLLGRLPRA